MPKIKPLQKVQERHYNYFPATFREGRSGKYVEYYVENPNTGQLERMRIKVNLIFKRFACKKDAKIHIYEIVSKLNMKLSNGWNPFYEHKVN